MVTLKLEITVEINGAATDADALPLVTIVRDDTHAVIAADAEMVRSGTGAYRYSFSGEEGVSYTGSGVAIVDGEENAFEKSAVVDAGVELLDSYHTLASARAMAPTLGLARVTAASDASLAAAMLLASIDIDGAMRYQGRKYDASQEREFPRKSGVRNAECGDFRSSLSELRSSSGVWDLDADGNAVVPEQVKLACAIQAESILVGDREERLAAIHDGITSQGADGLQEAYGGEARALCRRAHAIMVKYRLRSGAIL